VRTSQSWSQVYSVASFNIGPPTQSTHIDISAMPWRVLSPFMILLFSMCNSRYVAVTFLLNLCYCIIMIIGYTLCWKKGRQNSNHYNYGISYQN